MEISVAIIVKNEEDVIRRCLGCVSKFASQIVIVDTGSTDKTKEIISKEYSYVELYDSDKFNKDTHYSDFEFGTAKNEAIARCTNKWIIWWDADDFIDDNGTVKIKEIAEKSALDVIYDFMIIHGTANFYHSRMLPNDNGVKFDENHSCHEFLTVKKGIRRFKRGDIKIQHLPGKKGGLPSVERNIKIMEKDYYQKGRKDARTLFYLANSYRELRNNKEAIRFYEEYLTKSTWKEERLFARYYKSKCHFKLEENKKAVNEAIIAITEDDRFAEPYCLLGDMYFNFGKPEKAKAWYNMAKILKTPPSDAVLFVVPSLYNEYPKKRMKDCDNFSLDDIPKKEIKGNIPKNDSKEVIGIEILTSPDGQLKSALAINEFIRNFPHVIVKPIASDGKIIDKIFDGIENISVDGKIEVSGALKIESLSDSKNKNCVEWMARSLGFIPKSLKSSHSSSKVKKDLKKVLLVTELEYGEEWPSFKWELLAEKLKDNGYEVKYYNDFILEDKEFWNDGYGLIIGQNSIAPSLAQLTNSSAIIMHPDDKSVKNYGYEGQISIVQKINKITVIDVFQQVEKFLVEVR